jgi:1-deoxy-D-xylulose-5-phosphate synthase
VTFAPGMAPGHAARRALYSTSPSGPWTRSSRRRHQTWATSRWTAGFVSDDGETHQGLFDIALLLVPTPPLVPRAAPNESMHRWATLGTALRRGIEASCSHEIARFGSVEEGRGVSVRESGAGPNRLHRQPLSQAAEPPTSWRRRHPRGLYNLRFLKPVDEDRSRIMTPTNSSYSRKRAHGRAREYVASLGQRRGLRARVLTIELETSSGKPRGRSSRSAGLTRRIARPGPRRSAARAPHVLTSSAQ